MKKLFLLSLALLASFAMNLQADDLCSANFNGKTANSNTTGVAETGCTMKWSGVESTSNDVTVSGNTYRKFGSSGYVQLVLNSGSFQAGDVLTVTMSSNQNNKAVSFKLHSTSGNGPSDITVSSGEAKPSSYTLVETDIEDDGSIKIFRGGAANTNARYGSFSVSRESSDPVAVTGITIAPASKTIKVDRTVTLVATVTPSNATDKTVTWAVTSGSTYASVNASTGVVTGLAAGTATITATAHDGSGVTQTATITVEECPISGTMYKFQVKTGLENGNIASSVPNDIAATTDNYLSNLTGGSLTIAARNNVNRVQIVNNNAIGFANGADAFLKMDLDCDIEAGDSIKYTIASNNMELMAGSESESTNKMTLDRTKTAVVVDSKLVGASSLYMKRSSSSPNISYFEIVRPAKYTVTFNMHGHGDAVDAQTVVNGGKVTEPATTDITGWVFGGWFKESTYDNEWDFANDVVSAATELHAKWTEYVPSTDNEIKSLTIAGHAIIPSGTTYSYEVGKDDATAEVTVVYTIDALASAIPASGFKITVPAADAPAATQDIVVTAESGAKATYTVSVTKAAAASTVATLSDIKVDGATIEGFSAGTEEYEYAVGIYATDMPTVTYTLSDPKATAVHKPSNTTLVDTIDVTAEDGETKKTYKVIFVPTATELVSISASTTWDWSEAGSATAKLDGTTLPKNTDEFNFADVLINPDDEFNAAALKGIAQYANRGTYFQGTQLKFNTAKPGKVVVRYSNTGNKRPYRHVQVNDSVSINGEADGSAINSEEFPVAAGDVVIKFYIPDATNPQSGNDDVVGFTMCRVYKITFTADKGTSLDNTADEIKAVKFIENGQLFIRRGEKVYTITGELVK